MCISTLKFPSKNIMMLLPNLNRRGMVPTMSENNADIRRRALRDFMARNGLQVASWCQGAGVTETEARVGQRVMVRLSEAVPTTGGLLLELLTIEGADLPKPRAKGRGRPVTRKAGAARRKAKKMRRTRDRPRTV